MKKCKTFFCLYDSNPLLISTGFLKYPFRHSFQTGIKIQLWPNWIFFSVLMDISKNQWTSTGWLEPWTKSIFWNPVRRANTNRAWPSQPFLKNCQNGTFEPLNEIWIFYLAKNAFIWSAIWWLSQRSLKGIQKLFLFRVPLNL